MFQNAIRLHVAFAGMMWFAAAVLRDVIHVKRLQRMLDSERKLFLEEVLADAGVIPYRTEYLRVSDMRRAHPKRRQHDARIVQHQASGATARYSSTMAGLDMMLRQIGAMSLAH